MKFWYFIVLDVLIILGIYLFYITINNNKIMNKNFDVATFNKNKIDGVYSFTLLDGMKVEQTEFENSYQEKHSFENNPNDMLFSFDKKDGTLLIEGYNFFDVPIGKWKYYRKDGSLEKEINYDEPYLFSITDLVKLMKEKYNINLLEKDKIHSFNRYEEKNTGQVFYEVNVSDIVVPMKLNSYLIDGKTGEVLSITQEYIEE